VTVILFVSGCGGGGGSAAVEEGSRVVAKAIRPPPPVFDDALKISKGTKGVRSLAPRAEVIVRRVQDATPEELQDVVKSSACKLITLMITEQRFPTQDEAIGAVANALFEEGITIGLGDDLQNPAATLRGSLAEALTNEQGVIPQENLEEAATELGCEVIS
jgi:hypothetical protein